MSLEAILAELKKEYIEAIPSRISIIESLHRDRKAEELRDFFHKMKGSGKTYGVGELSQIGEIGELFCRRRPELLDRGVPLLLELLKTAHSRRCLNQIFDVSIDPGFSQLLKMTNEG